MKISIIKPNAKHTNDISRICATGWRQTVQGVHSEAYQLKNVEYWYNHKRVLEDIEKGTYTHVALVDDKVAGTIGGIMTAPNISEIYVFYVDEVFRYKGIGTKLLHEFTNIHINCGATEQVVSVEEGNTLGIPFYLSHGFRQREQDKRYWRKIGNK
ncbi:GNAT family N-acetyltransferase [Ornithinibacillus scapharcae]|uniref:GNAT family N-acetyltransferase n=1 Tax=Ornithinibacillus scapharcae TaxID=1147159 RepID=UPI000225BC9B|nr:GNAT family N-acetyltransferase [Ornithinibacillus scapharcae]